jgi:peptide/nickel transport system permease protein
MSAPHKTLALTVFTRLLRRPLNAAALLILLLMIICAIFAPLIAPYDPLPFGKDSLEAPGAQYWLGTDQLGRDILSRLIYGARISLSAGFITAGISAFIGIFVGLLSGYFGKGVDMLFMRLTDVFMTFPLLMLILVIISILGPSLKNIILVLGLLGWPPLARIVRGNVLSEKQREYVQACHVLGFSAARILCFHILPNIARPILVSITFSAAKNILLESSLSFLGVGVPLPTPSWGNMLSDINSLTMLTEYPWLWLPPSLAILLCVLAVNFLGDALVDAMDTQGGK